MLQAATLGDRQAMVYIAKAYDTGTGLGTQRYGIYSLPFIRTSLSFGRWNLTSFFCRQGETN